MLWKGGSFPIFLRAIFNKHKCITRSNRSKGLFFNILSRFYANERDLASLTMGCTDVHVGCLGFYYTNVRMFREVYGFLRGMYGFNEGCLGFSMVHGCFERYGCINERYGCDFFLCHPPTPTIWGAKRNYPLQPLFLSEMYNIF